MNALLLNDIHIGVVRTAGTTRDSQAAIQQYILDSLRDTIMSKTSIDLIINGDLFDGFDVDGGQLLATYIIFFEWLKASGRVLHLVRGNHDIAKNSLRTSAFAMLCELLKKSFPDQVCVYNDRFSQITGDVYVIPHCVNQDLFDIELQHALEAEIFPGSLLLLHANVDNKFAVEADHSLNVSDEWLRKLTGAGWTLVFAHEHQARTLMAGKVIVLGNQWPTSVADCMAHGAAQKDGTKYMHIIDGTDLTPIPTWFAEADFVEMPWDELVETPARFIRIVGKAEADRAADVISAISKYRQQSKALVITNAVEVAGMAGINDMSKMSVESLQAINILDALCEELTKEEGIRVRALLDDEDR